VAATRRLQELAPEVGVGRGRAVLFDLDRTLVPGSSLMPLARVLAERGVVTRAAMAAHVATNLAFRWRAAGDGHVDRIKATALLAAAGAEHAMLLEAAACAGHAVADHVYPSARRLLGRHLDAGDFCVILSAAPQELVEVVSARLGAHRAVGSRPAVCDGRLTGELVGPFCYGEGKLVRLAAEVGPVELVTAHAYADSCSDLPLLLACGHPTAVNPDRGLRQAARQRGWPVLRFR
jgi:HAD superfamily hydrolase (TIGR01490 family)